LRQLMQCRAMSNLCFMLIASLISPFVQPFVQPAAAQLMPTYQVGVVDFVNESGVQGQLLARLATDAVVVEMSKTNRYDVSITRAQLANEMEKLGLHPPLSKLGLVRLGEALQADAMLEGSIKSVSLAGSGATRRASVTLVVQMIDQASGEVINGAVQTGTSSARVGFTPDDDSLITEAINNAAFLCVKTMIDYVIPEGTVLMNIGESMLMINKGARDGMKPGMRLIILRQREIIGYVVVQKVSATSCDAKVMKSMRGIQPEDKARAIFDMPMVISSLKSEPLPSGAPAGGGTGARGAASKIGKFLVGAAIVFGLASLFKGGRGSEDAPVIGVAGPMEVTWDPSKYGHGTNVLEYQILRNAEWDDFNAQPVKVIRDPSAIDAGHTNLMGLYGTGTGTAVSYYGLAGNPATSYTEKSWTVPAEPYGNTYRYTVRVLYKITTGSGTSAVTQYRYTPVSNVIIATAIQPVLNSDVISPAYDPSLPAPEVLVSDLQQGDVTFQWNRKDGANVYYVTVEAIPSTGVIWQSDPIYETGPTITLPASERLELASILANYGGRVLKWIVYCRNTGDTSPAWVKGQENRFEVGATPPPGP